MTTSPDILRPAIIAARKSAPMTQAQLAAAAGATQPQLSKFERGTADLNSATLDRIIAALGPRRVASEIRRLTAPATTR